MPAGCGWTGPGRIEDRATVAVLSLLATVLLTMNAGGVLQRDAAAGQARHVVHDDVVVEVDAVPLADPGRAAVRVEDVRAVDELGADAAAVAAPAWLPWIRLASTLTLPAPSSARWARWARYLR